MEQDPPPDLAIEADVTSKTTLESYAALQVPEVWIYGNEQLRINLWQNGVYQESLSSPTFPNLPVVEMIPRLVQQAFVKGTSTMLRSLRQELSQSQ